MTMKKQIIYMVCATALLSSCHIYKAYDRPDTIETSGIYRDPVSAAGTLAETDTTNMGNLPWQEVFRDPKLQALIEEGLANNVDLQAAILRVEEAKLLLTSARLSFLPSLNLAPQGTITKMENTGYVKAYTLPAVASWEVDLFGKLLNASRGQKTAYLQSQYTQQAIRSQLIGGIANTYFTLLMLDRQVEITSKTVDIYKENVRVMEAMKIAGMTTEAAVVQMRAVFHQVSGSLIELKRQVREVENSLSVLLAKAPQPIDRSTLEDQVMPEELMAGVPLQLLENRPDVKVAEMTLASAYYTTNKARAAFYPGINITATAGWTNGSGVTVSNPGQFMFQALASLAQPIFNNGKLVANLKISKAEEQIAKMNYQQTILEAGKEVSDALHLYDATNRKLVQDQAQIEELEKAVAYTNALFQSGQSTYLEILSAQQSLLSAQLTEVSDNVQRMQAVINLYSAIGGGRE
ncbi:efflux transporter outer membrane subunit [Parabacteroides johnsonii]|uniref:efflux transporter outer membrane subunit n=1 Tax=Parabacteroides johnsonii TaxID=387661 RepID=UPI00242AB412|nr:TolC family protein [Parabacteroides johnsonii]